MRALCEIIKEQAEPNFVNLETAIRTYDRNALVCGAPAWRYVYHTIHSADKWFFDPFVYDEPDFHEDGMDNPDNPCGIELSDEQLLDYLHRVRTKTLDYIDRLNDEMLYEKPDNCNFTRMELVLRQFRHISFHTGMLNGLTAEIKGKFPIYVASDTYDRLNAGLFDDGVEEMNGKSSEINHIAMYVSDLEKSKDFYVKYFGAVSNKKYCNPNTGLETYFLSFDGDVRLEIMKRPDCKEGDRAGFSTGFTHIAFSVGDRESVDKLTERLGSDGYSVVGLPRVTGDGYYESVVLDNDGNRIEITE